MTQIILTVIEDLLMSIFISKYTYLEKNKFFIIIATLLFTFETTLVEYIPKLSILLPMIIFITTLFVIFFYKRSIIFNDVVGSLLAPTMILLTDILSLVLLSFSLSLSIDAITNNIHYMLTASILSKVFLALAYIMILNFNSHSKIILNYKDWWMLLPIWIVIFIILYFLGESIILNDVSLKTIYVVTIFLLILSAFFLILFYKIQMENDIKHKNELVKQKEFYMKKNYEMIKKMHNEIIEIEHSTIYSFLHIKGLLINKDYDEIESFLDKNIYKSRKFKNIINSGNPYFDHVLNKSVNNILSQNGDIKTSIQITNKNFEIEKSQLDIISSTIELLFNISDKNSFLDLNIIQKNKYIIITLIISNLQKIPNDYKKIFDIYETNEKISYSYKKIDNYYIFKILIETEMFFNEYM